MVPGWSNTIARSYPNRALVRLLLPTFGAPDWLFRIYAIVVIAGFLVAVVAAWIFEWTPEGIRLETDLEHAAPQP